MDLKVKEELQKGFDESVAKSNEALKAELKADSDAKLKEVSDKLVEAEAKIKKIEDLKLDKSFQINKNAFPVKVKFAGKEYNMDSQGEQTSIDIASSKNKDLFKIFGKDNEANYNFKKWALATFQAAAFPKNLRLHEERENVVSEILKASDMVEGTDAQGGYGVPIQYESEFILLARETSFALNECSVLNVSTNSIKWPKELTGTSVSYPGEATAPTAVDVTQAQLSIAILKAMIWTHGISRELIQDSVFDIVGYLTGDMSYAMAQNYDNQVVNGASATWTANKGLLTSAVTNSVELSGASSASFSGISDVDLSQALDTISNEADPKAKFLMNKSIMHLIRTIKDTTGRNIFQPSQIPGTPSTIWERPVVYTSKATKTTAASTSFIVVGDLKQFLICRMPGGMVIESDPYSEFSKDLIAYRTIDRHGLGIKRAGDFCKITTSA